MARTVRRFGPYLAVLVILIGISALLVPAPREAEAAIFGDPFWSNDSPQPECMDCGCGCPTPPLWSEGNVNLLTLEGRVDIFLFYTKGMVADLPVSVSWRSHRDGMTQVGNGCVLSLENTVEENIINKGDPDAEGGTEVYWRSEKGIVTYVSDGLGGFTTDDCSVQHTLTHNSPYTLTDKQGNAMLFDANGMPDKYTDRNGNELDFTYNSSYQITGLTDTRGGTFTFSHDADGFLEEIQTPGAQSWMLDYDANGNLVTIDTPPTADQPSGITTTIAYDAYGRISSVEDGRNNTVNAYTWVGTTRQIDKVTIDGDDVEYTLTAGRTDRTDRNGNIHRTFHTGANITKTDMYVNSVSKYATNYIYSGSLVATIVFPRGNRIDYTWDGNDNLTERRHRTNNTSTNHATDLVHAWTYLNNFVMSYTDPVGNETSFTRDAYGNVTKITYPTVTSPATQAADKDITYNNSGQITQVTDEEEKVINYSYIGAGSSLGLLDKIEVDPTGLDLETTFAYDGAGNTLATTTPRGHTTDFEWDNLRRLTKRTAPSPLSYETKYEYDGNGNIVKKEVQNKDKDGEEVGANPWITTTYTYTNEDRLLTIVEELTSATTRTTTLAYDDNGNRIRVTKPEGNKDKWTFNERDLVASLIRGETSGVASTAEYTYDDNGNRTVVEDARDNDWTTVYDLFDRRTKVTDPLGHYLEYDLDKVGRATEESRSNSSDTELARRSLYYDERGRLWKTSDLHKDPGTTYSDAVTQIERFKTGHVKTVTDARSKDTDYGYDNAWRRTTVTDAMGNETASTLDDNGNPTAWAIEEVDGQGTVTHEYEATYDVLNRRLTYVEIDRNDGQNELTTTSGYDSRGNLVWLVNSEGDPTRWSFDAAGRMLKKEVALATGQTIEDFTSAIETEWGFDDNNRLTSHKDDAGNDSTWQYDAKDRMTKLIYPDAEEIQYTYDAGDNVTQVIDAAGNDIDDTYDDNSRRTARSVTRAQGFLGTTSETFTYDGLGRMTEASDNDYKVEFSHGVIGLSSEVYEEKQSFVGQTAYLRTVRRTYDAVGNKITELYPSNLDLDYTWSDLNRLATVTDGTNTIASYSYIGVRRKSVTFQSGATASYSYTGFRGEVARIHHETSNPATIVDLQYGYDDNHDRLYERLGASGQSGDAYAYDKARRLTTAWMGSATPANPTSAAYVKNIEYNMDDEGNRSSVVLTPYQQGSSTTSYTDNSLNQYTAVGGTGQGHDDNGNLTDDGTLDYEYDYRNQIVRVKQDSTTIAEYKYDALGRRIEKDDQTTTHRYIYSGAETVSVYGATDVFIRNFVFGAVIDEVLMLQQADLLDFDSDQDTNETTRSFYHRNALGSVMEITDMNDAEVASYRYDPYGAVTITIGGTPQGSDPLGQPWMYTSRFTDEETGLYYYRARYYSPETGRFLQRDPLGYTTGANLYEYVGSSPLVWGDPLGLVPDREQPNGLEALGEALAWTIESMLRQIWGGCAGPGTCHCVLMYTYSATTTTVDSETTYGIKRTADTRTFIFGWGYKLAAHFQVSVSTTSTTTTKTCQYKVFRCWPARPPLCRARKVVEGACTSTTSDPTTTSHGTGGFGLAWGRETPSGKITGTIGPRMYNQIVGGRSEAIAKDRSGAEEVSRVGPIPQTAGTK